MYFVRYQPLKEKLKNRELTDREALPYLLISSILTALATSFPFTDNFNSVGVINGITTLGLAILGVLYAYKKNGKENGYDLIQKYLVLGWVVFVRCFLLFIPVFIAYMIIGRKFGIIDIKSNETSLYELIFYIAFEALIYVRIGYHIGETKR